MIDAPLQPADATATPPSDVAVAALPGTDATIVDLAAVITYERNSWGNNVGDMLQPIDVANFKKGK